MLKVLIFIFVCAFAISSCDNEFGTSSVILHKNNSPVQTAFLDLGQYSGQTNDGVKYKKHYYFSKYFKSTWVEAKAICKSFDLELVTFETRVEAEFFFKKIATIYYFTNFDEKYVLVDGFSSTPKSTTDWYWTNSGLKVPYNMQWLEGEPNHTEGMENCLSIGRKMQNQKIGFNDIPCYKYSYKFVCQKTIMM